jgi:two-component system NtrC family response regulator
MKPKLIIVDDDEEIRTQMKWALNEEYEILLAEDRSSALGLFKEHHPPVALLDLGLPPHPATPEEGLCTLSDMLSMDQFAKIIIVSGQGESANALRAVGDGAYDFLSKPVEVEELRIILKRAFHLATLERDYRQLQSRIQSDTFEGLLGNSPQIQQVFTLIRKVATTEVPVLILGESGTGKEMAALAIHKRSQRKDGPFVAINCSAIPETLLESELFGHEKGSFTGAHVQRKGRIETASGGTLFLDEIGEIPLQLQVKLLRFLQEQRIERVGGRQELQVDTRVVAATNVDLKKAILAGRFREDLYYRLAVVTLNLPALRDRTGDISVLAQEFLRRNAQASGKEVLSFSQDALRALKTYSWPGNVRELENRIKRAVIMADGKRLSAEDLELESFSSVPGGLNLKEAREAAERDVVQRALRRHSGKIAPAAAELGISRPTLYELMEKLGIGKPEREVKPDDAKEPPSPQGVPSGEPGVAAE